MKLSLSSKFMTGRRGRLALTPTWPAGMRAAPPHGTFIVGARPEDLEVPRFVLVDDREALAEVAVAVLLAISPMILTASARSTHARARCAGVP